MATLKHRGSTLYIFSNFSERETCKSIPGHAWNGEYKCWTYPFASLETIKDRFPGIALPETIEKYIEMRRTSSMQLEKTKVEGGDWEHPFLMQHQKMGVDIARTKKRFAFFYDTGTGKTIMMLGVEEDRPMITLVICPLAIIRPAWIEDAMNFFPNLKVVSLNPGRDKSRKKLIRALNSGANIFIVNFESFKILYDTILQLKINRLVIDESSKMKNHTSQITKDILAFGKTVEECYILSGTPAPNSELEYYPQIQLVAPGLLGPSFPSYKNYYFMKDPHNQYKVYLNPDKKQELMDKIGQVAIYVSKDDCLDLPPYTFQMVEIDMAPEHKKIYKQMEKDQFAQITDDTVVLTPNKLAALMKLRQITSGFILDENKSPHFISDAKLNALRDELESIGTKQAIIWIQFHEEVNRIRAMLAKEFGPETVRALYGGTAKTDGTISKDDDETVKDAVVREFKAGKFQWLLAHPRTAMYGLTFVNCSYAYYYSMSHSYEEFH